MTNIARFIGIEKCSIVLLFDNFIDNLIQNPDILENFKGYAKMISTLGLPLHRSTANRIFDALPSVCVLEIMFTIEAGLVYSKIWTASDIDPQAILLPLVKLPIRDRKGDVVERGQVGELCTKNMTFLRPNISKDKNKRYLDNWLKTNALAVMSDSGAVNLLGKKNEIIIVDNFKVYLLSTERERERESHR